MTIYLGKSCSFCLPRVPFVNCRQFMYLVISLLVLRAGYGIWLYQFLIFAYLFTLKILVAMVTSCLVIPYLQWYEISVMLRRFSSLISVLIIIRLFSQTNIVFSNHSILCMIPIQENNETRECTTIKSCCFLTSTLVSFLKVSKFDPSFILLVFCVSLAWVLFLTFE